MMTSCICRTVLISAFLAAMGAVGVVVATASSNSTGGAYFSSLPESERTGYVNWLADHGSVQYPRHLFLPTTTDPENGAAVFWTFLDDGTDLAVEREAGASAPGTAATHIQFAVAVRATGWVALGLSEVGGMLGSDVAIFEAANPTEMIDAYILEARIPVVDDCAGNWMLVRHTNTSDGWLIVEFSRPLDTKDPQDRAIIDDTNLQAPTRLISAWGDTEVVSYHGSNVARNAAKLFGTPEGADLVLEFEKLMETQADGYFDVRESNYSIPEAETTYYVFCKTFADLKAEFNLPGTENDTLTFIGGEAVLSPGTEQYVHHFIGMESPAFLIPPLDIGLPNGAMLFEPLSFILVSISCHFVLFSSVSGSISSENCSDTGASMLWAWAPGTINNSWNHPRGGVSLANFSSAFNSLFIQFHSIFCPL